MAVGERGCMTRYRETNVRDLDANSFERGMLCWSTARTGTLRRNGSARCAAAAHGPTPQERNVMEEDRQAVRQGACTKLDAFGS
jgi:hypothetical protein